MTINANPRECPACFGTGFEPVMQPVRLGKKINPLPPCPQCSGTGKEPTPDSKAS